MGKKKTSEKRRIFSKKPNFIEIHGILYEEEEPLDWLLDEDNVLAGLAECVKDRDMKGAFEIMRTYQWARRRAKKIEKESMHAEGSMVTAEPTIHSREEQSSHNSPVAIAARSRSKF